jgi:hypothetical protein
MQYFVNQDLRRIGFSMLYSLCFVFLTGCQPADYEARVKERQSILVLVKIPGNGETEEELQSSYVRPINEMLQTIDTGKVVGRPGVLISAEGSVDYVELRILSKDPESLSTLLEKELRELGAPSGVVAEWNGKRVVVNPRGHGDSDSKDREN